MYMTVIQWFYTMMSAILDTNVQDHTPRRDIAIT